MDKCAAVKTGIVKRKGRASLEFFYYGRPHYYCFGYTDRLTDDLIDVCQSCKSNVRFAQDDLDALRGRNADGT